MLPSSLANPPVGCVIVDADEIVSQAYTRAPGQYHAEAGVLAFHSFLVRNLFNPLTFDFLLYHRLIFAPTNNE